MAEFQNSAGRVFQIRPLPPLQDAIIIKNVRRKWLDEKGSMPTVPTYEVKTASGRVEVYDHDDTTEKNDDELKAWNEYKTGQAMLERMIYDQRIRAAIQCLAVDPLEDGRWISRMRFMGIELPDDPCELLNLYAETEVIADGNRDALMLLMHTAGAAGILDQEVVRSLEDQFFREDKRKDDSGNPERKKKQKAGGG